jgi:murein peptide amidase A
MGMVQKSGRNHGGYFGERIEVDHVLDDINREAVNAGWRSEVFLDSDSVRLIALRRPSGSDRPRVYLSAGIHGDEPAGPLTVRRLFFEKLWPVGVDLWLCPCLNPSGFRLNRRENAEGLDLNRQYLHLRAAETRAHIAWLEKQPRFDLAICLHEDWESQGFYLYELNPDRLRSYADSVIATVSRVCPIDPSPEIEGRPASGGIIRPSGDLRSRPEWPEAFYLFTHKTRLSYTLEAPSDFPIETRVNALVAAVETVLESVATG